MQLGYEHETGDYIDFLLQKCARCGDEPHLMLGIGSEHDLSERSLEHLEGYPSSAPVRVGNGAQEAAWPSTAWRHCPCAATRTHWWAS